MVRVSTVAAPKLVITPVRGISLRQGREGERSKGVQKEKRERTLKERKRQIYRKRLIWRRKEKLRKRKGIEVGKEQEKK